MGSDDDIDGGGGGAVGYSSRMKRCRWLFASAAFAALGCGASSGNHDEPLGDGATVDSGPVVGDAAPLDATSGVTLRIEPTEVALVVPLGGASGSAPLKVFARAPGAAEVDVTARASFSLGDPTLATFAGASVGNATHGGTATITASADGASATASLKVKLTGEVVPSDFDLSAKAKFATAAVDPSPASQPKLEYPLDGVIVPSNVPPIEAQWTAGGDSTAWRLRVTAPDVLDVTLYATTREATFARDAWSTIVASAAGTKAQLVVEGLGAAVHRSAPVGVTVARDRIDDSAIYYWESSSGAMRVLDFAAGKNALLPVTGSAYAPGKTGQCVACHTVSRDGTRFAYTTGDFAFGTLEAAADKKSFAASVEPGTKIPAGFKWTYAAFAPDEAKTTPAVLVTKADVTATQNAAGHVRLALLDPKSGAEVSNNLVDWLAGFPAGVGRDLLQPDWSPGGFVVFAAYDSERPNPDPSAALKSAYVRDLGDDAVATSIVEAPIAWDGAKKSFAFGAPRVLVAAKPGASLDVAETDVLPAISPDDALVAFTRSTGWWSIRLQSDAVNGSGRITVVRRADGTVIELANASGPPSSNSTWPQWAPTAGSDYLWLAFSTERPYGHRMAPGVALPAECLPQGRSLCKNMWVTAISRKAAASGTADPSAPPFWLPGQTALASAVSPRWTKAVVTGPK